MVNYIKHIYNAFKNSLYGLYYVLFEKAFRIEIIISFFLIPLTLYYNHNPIKIAIIMFAWFIVLITEIINTAIEKTIDRISNKKHILSKKAKDLGSAAVFLSIVNIFIIYFIMIFY